MGLKYRKVDLYVGGTDFAGYISRGEDEERTRHNTWNGWECPVMTLEQTKDFVELQNWRIFEGEHMDKWELTLDDEGWKLTIWDCEEKNTDEDWDTFKSRTDEPYCISRLSSVETVSGDAVEVFPTPCYTFELVHGDPNETCNMVRIKASAYWKQRIEE
jgi:hypothetical protein